jgi:pyruvate kinase
VRVRQEDLRHLQLELWQRGLSSLGRLESHVLDSLQQVRARVTDALIARGVAVTPPPVEPALSWDEAEERLHAHSRALLGPRPANRHVYIMVTAPAASEADAAWAERLIAAGTNLVRINAAHEEPDAWSKIVEVVRAASARTGVPVRILVDLPGPKLRTVLPDAGVRVARWRPTRDELGRVVAAQPVRIVPGARAGADATTLAVPPEVWDTLATGDRLVLRDARGRRRRLEVVERQPDHAVATATATTYLTPGVEVALQHGERTALRFTLDDVPARPPSLRLAPGDVVALAALGEDAQPEAQRDGLPLIGCPEPDAIASLAPGQRILFDDGHVEARVEAVDAGVARLRVIHARGGAVKLREGKGINLPDTRLAMPALPPADRRALAFAIAHADAVGLSFVRGPDDVRALHAALAEAAAPDALGVVLKIETVEAAASLPAILLAALERAPAGVMIARGDLAVEAGFERLAELQEEILWMCEAAHLPVVWATQVLDSLARDGRPSRAEVTDAAMAVRAECVMLNKGPYVAEAVRVLDDILRRMEEHQYKKRSLYRRLRTASL